MKGDRPHVPRTAGEQISAVPVPTTAPRRITSAALLQGQRQIVIEHVGREYRLQLTASGKLIMTA